jgi:hypothetical protein
MICQQNNEILSGDGQNKIVSSTRGDFSSLQFFRNPALAVVSLLIYFAQQRNLSNEFHLFLSSKLAL